MEVRVWSELTKLLEGEMGKRIEDEITMTGYVCCSNDKLVRSR